MARSTARLVSGGRGSPGAAGRGRPGLGGPSTGWLERLDATTSLVLTLPVFVLYELGLLVSDRANGADFITRTIIRLLHLTRERYIYFNVGLLVVLLVVILALRRQRQLRLRSLASILVESAIYAATMGTAILLIMRYVLRADLWLRRAMHWLGEAPKLALSDGLTLLDKVVISLGAGFHEELVFRLIGLGGLVYIATGPLTGGGGGRGPRGALASLEQGGILHWRRGVALVFAYLISALLFSAAHHVGPAAEPFRMDAFVYRFLAGIIFGLIYHLRGFATAVYTHTFYDLIVLVLR
jgi:hypothetical protein